MKKLGRYLMISSLILVNTIKAGEEWATESDSDREEFAAYVAEQRRISDHASHLLDLATPIELPSPAASTVSGASPEHYIKAYRVDMNDPAFNTLIHHVTMIYENAKPGIRSMPSSSIAHEVRGQVYDREDYIDLSQAHKDRKLAIEEFHELRAQGKIVYAGITVQGLERHGMRYFTLRYRTKD